MAIQDIEINTKEGISVKAILFTDKDLPKDKQTLFIITIPGDDN